MLVGYINDRCRIKMRLLDRCFIVKLMLANYNKKSNGEGRAAVHPILVNVTIQRLIKRDGCCYCCCEFLPPPSSLSFLHHPKITDSTDMILFAAELFRLGVDIPWRDWALERAGRAQENGRARMVGHWRTYPSLQLRGADTYDTNWRIWGTISKD